MTSRTAAASGVDPKGMLPHIRLDSMSAGACSGWRGALAACEFNANEAAFLKPIPFSI